MVTAPDLGITGEAVEAALIALDAGGAYRVSRGYINERDVCIVLAAAVPLLRKAWEQEECERPQCLQIAQTASEVYGDLTGGKLSYPTYEARTIISEAEACSQEWTDKALAEQRERIAREVETAPITFTQDAERMAWGHGVQLALAESIRAAISEAS